MPELNTNHFNFWQHQHKVTLFCLCPQTLVHCQVSWSQKLLSIILLEDRQRIRWGFLVWPLLFFSNLHGNRGLKYSETRLLRTLKRNEKRYVLTVRFIQNVIFLTGRTGSTCSRKLFVRWNRLSGHRTLENVLGNWNRNWKVGWHARDQKKEPKNGQKSAPGGKIGT